MTQGAELLIRAVTMSGSPALVAVVGGSSAIVTLQTILLELVTGSAGARVLHRHPTVLAGPEGFTVGHRLAMVADLAGIRPVAQIALPLLCALTMLRVPGRLLVRDRRLLSMALLAVTGLVALCAGLRLRPRGLTVRRCRPTLRVRHADLMAGTTLALAMAQGAVGSPTLARCPVAAEPSTLVRGRYLMLVTGTAELLLVTKIAITGFAGNALAGVQSLPARWMGHLHAVVATAAGGGAVTAQALVHRLEGVAPVAFFPDFRLVVSRLPALMAGAARLDGMALSTSLILIALPVARQELGVVGWRQPLSVAMLTRGQGMAGRARRRLLRRSLTVLGQPVQRMLGMQLVASVTGFLLMALRAGTGVFTRLLSMG